MLDTLVTMNLTLKQGTYSTVLALVASVAFFLFPEKRWVAYVIGALAGLLLLSSILWKEKSFWHWWFAQGPVWIPMHAALNYLALSSKWSTKHSKAELSQAESLLKEEFLERLARNEIRARGRPVVSSMDQKIASATETIPADFWPYAFLQPFGEIVLEDDRRGIAFTDSQFNQNPVRSYRGVLVCKDDIVKVWPKRRWAVLGRKKGPFWQAIADHRNGVDRNPNFEFEDEFFLRTAGHSKTDC